MHAAQDQKMISSQVLPMEVMIYGMIVDSSAPTGGSRWRHPAIQPVARCQDLPNFRGDSADFSPLVPSDEIGVTQLVEASTGCARLPGALRWPHEPSEVPRHRLH